MRRTLGAKRPGSPGRADQRTSQLGAVPHSGLLHGGIAAARLNDLPSVRREERGAREALDEDDFLGADDVAAPGELAGEEPPALSRVTEARAG